VIVLAAGGGTRMKSATPKVLHTIGGRSLVGHALVAARGVSPLNLAVVVGHGRGTVTPHVLEQTPEAVIAVQREQRGTGHAVQTALEALPPLHGTVVVTYGDVPLQTSATLQSLIDAHHSGNNAVTILTARVPDPHGYGRIVRSDSGAVVGIVEEKDATEIQRSITEINSGIFAYDAAVLREALGQIDDHNAAGEFYLTDVVGIVARSGRHVGATRTDDIWATEGVNTREQLSRIGAELNRRVLQRWMAEGVEVIDPATTWVDVTVRLASDVRLKPGVQLHGATVVETGAAIGPDTTLINVQVGAGAEVVRTHGLDAVLGPGSTVGPFAYLRPGTVLGDDGKVGTFVETKNATIGSRAKVPHLSYVGDADIGESTNIGAGTIFANYDGLAKHHTTVGAHAHTGAHNTFVAPIEIGDGATTGAGAVIRRSVPPGALAVSGGPQRHVDDWIHRKRPESLAAEAAKAAQAAQAAHTAEAESEEADQ
jgi:bifunctional UDP-N-acetylglucosamine pyrophosphorylase/glucosamine-1-phosphate N-acetyltransferase